MPISLLPPCPYCGHEHPEWSLKCPRNDMVLPLEGRLLSEKFRLSRELGKGGMATVWLAINTLVDRPVAIKLIRPQVIRDEDVVGRFRSEAKAAGRIGHPNVCDILDFGTSPVGPYIVMEYLQGRNLGQVITREGKLEAPRAIAIVRQALAGLHAAHERGIVHRDLKPENVFLHEPPGGAPAVKLMDFGVAKFTDGTAEVETGKGALLGTPEYMAPEQFAGAALAEPRTDIWAVGGILYRAVTGEHAFQGPTVAATLMRATKESPRKMRELEPTVPERLEAIVSTCLQKEPQDRYPTVLELDQELAELQEELEVAHIAPRLVERGHELDRVGPILVGPPSLREVSAALGAPSMPGTPSFSPPLAPARSRATPSFGGTLSAQAVAPSIVPPDRTVGTGLGPKAVDVREDALETVARKDVRDEYDEPGAIGEEDPAPQPADIDEALTEPIDLDEERTDSQALRRPGDIAGIVGPAPPDLASNDEEATPPEVDVAVPRTIEDMTTGIAATLHRGENETAATKRRRIPWSGVWLVLLFALGAAGAYRLQGDSTDPPQDARGEPLGRALASQSRAPAEPAREPEAAPEPGPAPETTSALPTRHGDAGDETEAEETTGPLLDDPAPAQDDLEMIEILEEDAESTDFEEPDARKPVPKRRVNAQSTPRVDTAKLPSSVVHVGNYVAFVGRTPRLDQGAARRYCRGLAASDALGMDAWKLANPTVAGKFAGRSAADRALKRGRYWTSARHKGRARVVEFPTQRTASMKVERKFRPLCVARWP